MPYVLTAPPSGEPVSVDEAKLHLRVTDTAQDALIGAVITAARVHAENITQRQFMTATWQLVLDAFPGPALMGVPPGEVYTLPDHAILVNKTPVASVSSIQYLDMSSSWQTMPSGDYTLDRSSEPARITPVFGKIWPVTLPQIAAVKVTFVAGYGAASDVPEGLKSWIKVRVGTLFENREEIALVMPHLLGRKRGPAAAKKTRRPAAPKGTPGGCGASDK